jgi:hypothetical protein
VNKNIQALAVSIEAQYKRTAVLRQSLSKENPDPYEGDSSQSEANATENPSGSSGGPTPANPQGQSRENRPDQSEGSQGPPTVDVLQAKSFVGYVTKSLEEWRSSDEYKTGIDVVRTWRKKMGLSVSGNSPGSLVPEEAGRIKVREIVGALRGDESIKKEEITGYRLDRDVNAYLIQYTRLSQSAGATTKDEKNDSSSDPKMRDSPMSPYEESLEDDARFKGKFPDQRISMNLLLRSAHADPDKYRLEIPRHQGADQSGTRRELNVLSQDLCDKNDPTRMRYFHIPANNMEVRSSNAFYLTRA